MAEKKMNKIRRAPSLDKEVKQQDQPLRGAGDMTAALKKNTAASSAPKGDLFNTSTVKKGLNKIGEAKNKLPIGRIFPAKSDGLGPIKNQTSSSAKSTQKNAQAQAQKKRQSNQQGNSQNAKRNSKTATAGNASSNSQNAQKSPQRNAQNAQKNTQNKRTQSGRQSAKGNQRNKKSSNMPSVKAYFLGGLNEIGKNMTLFECQGDMIIVDCGMAFPGEDMLGIDIVIPDFSFVESNLDKIKAIIITHGHEDHIGGLPYLLKRVTNVPVYGTAMTIALIQHKLDEHGVKAQMNVTRAGDHVKAGCFDVEFIHVNHSISDAVGLAINSPAGTIIHTGDFKIDCTPVDGQMIDIPRFAEYGQRGVLALLADSTNAERQGYTQTEQMVNSTLDTLFAKAEGKRLIIATFASNISRVQQIINCAVKYKRKVALNGRSMLNVMGIATELGYLDVPDGLLIEMSMINRYENGQVVLITTGSQGEPMSALTRMAFAEHRQVEVGPDDFIILSARPIPGNEKMVGAVVDELLKKGCFVVYESIYDVHVSGHACQEELKMIQAITKPKYFVPVHGEQKHLRKHAGLSMALGMPDKNIFVGTIGSALEINEDYIKELPEVAAGSVMVDGFGVGDVGNIVLRDRKHLSEDGIIIIVTTLEPSTGQIVSGPDIVSRGFVYVKESEILMDETRKFVYNIIQDNLDKGVFDHNAIKQSIREQLSSLLYKRTKRNPMVVPILMDV